MGTRAILKDNERLTSAQKEANDFQWYREKIDSFDVEANSNYNTGTSGISEYKRMKVNYDLFNNILNLSDFEYVCSPYGANVGELPAQMVNRDISSNRIKALQGMESKKPFNYKILAVNPDATSRKEVEETSRIRQFVVEGIMKPIQQQIELKYQEELQGKLTPQQRQEIQQKIEQEITAQTPPQVKKYMKRDHQDPSEIQGQQILNYLTKQQDVKRKLNNGWKHALLSAYEIYWIGIVNGKPILKVVNPLRFNFEKSEEVEFIEDARWGVAEFRMHPSEIVTMFDLTDTEIDKVYENYQHTIGIHTQSNLFNFDSDVDIKDSGVKVIHSQFKGLRQVQWLDYIDKDGVLQKKMLVDENYKLNRDIGDVSITKEWIVQTYEGYKIGTKIYKQMGLVEGQLKDIDNAYESKLSYYGAVYDNMNSQATSIMDRMKVYQYYYNIVMYRIELLMASDDGKKILMNINAIPESAGIDIEKWQYFFKSSPFMWFNPDEEGMNQSDINTVAKTLDLSLASDINKYIELAEYLEQKCGKSVGVTDPVLGQTAVSERVSNNQQNLVQTSYILEPYFDLHNCVKKNILQGLLNVAKIAYINSDLKVLTNVLDDMSVEILNLDINLLASNTLGLFVEDSSISEGIRETIQNLAHAAMQNQKVELSDVLKIIRQDSIQESSEILEVAEQTRIEREQADAEANRKFQSEQADKIRAHEKEAWDNEKDDIILKEEERRKTDIQKQLILTLGFDPEKDRDQDGVADALEVARDGINANIQMKKEARESRALDHKIEDDKEKNKLKSREITSKNNSKK
jgi:hypothetical protein